jgi:hemerythrin
MTELKLDAAFVSGHRGVDGEHHLQLSLLAAVRQAVAGGRPADEIEDLLDRLIEFTKVHFASEVTLMRLYQYPQFQAHVLEHERTLDEIDALRAAWRAGTIPLTDDRLDALSDWLQSHIGGTDAAFGRYLVRLGVGPG